MVGSNKTDRILDEREATILRAVVFDYIATGKPVGSRSFVQKYSLSVSPATMRNIMSDLEQLGYLMQPHTSSGRIPTDQGYRFYVDSMLDTYEFKMDGEIRIKTDALKGEIDLDKIFSMITRMLSIESRYAGIILTPKPNFTVLKRIELIPLSGNEILAVLITRTGMVINKKVTVSDNITQDALHDYSKYLTAQLCGYAINEIKGVIYDRLRAEKTPGLNKELALDITELALKDSQESELRLDGIENLLRIPEMVENEKLNSLLNIIEEKNILKIIMEKAIGNEGIRTLIGREIEIEKVKGCSMVATAYRIGNKNVGAVGVIGPTRMDYEKIVPLVDYTGKIISEFLTSVSE